jgi:hypothetical protein
MNEDLTSATFYAGAYSITADVVTARRRLFDVLRDTSRKYLDVQALRVAPLEQPAAVRQYPTGLLSKSHIDYAIVWAEPDRAGARLYAYVQKFPVPAAVVLSRWRIDGTVHVESGHTDPITFFLRGLERSTERFLAITDARISPDPTAGRLADRVVIVNRSAIQLYSVNGQA